MEIVKKRRPVEIAYGFFLLSHPAPVLLHVIGVTVFTLLAAWPQPIWGVILLVIGAHTAMQISIAMINDYRDRRVDAAAKPKKPIPRGLVYPHEALIAGLFMIVVMLLLLLPLPRLALLISLTYLALGQGYNLGLKATPFSGIVFALARWKRHSRVSLLTLAALVIYFARILLFTPIRYWLPNIMGSMFHASNTGIDWAYTLVSLIEDFAFAGVVVLLVVAAFSRRAPKPAIPS